MSESLDGAIDTINYLEKENQKLQAQVKELEEGNVNNLKDVLEDLGYSKETQNLIISRFKLTQKGGKE